MLTKEQREIRRFGIGGSDVGAIAGLNPWKSPLEVYFDKTEGEVQEENDAMHWGSVLEDTIAKEYSKIIELKIRRVPWVHGIKKHSEYPFILASLDRQIVGSAEGPGVLEIKTAGFRSDEWGEQFTDQVPEHYYLQVMQYLLVTGYRWAHLAVLFLVDREFCIYRIDADQDIFKWLIELEKKFWLDHVQARVPPEPRTLADLKRLYPRDNGEAIESTPEIVMDLSRLKEVKKSVKQLETEKTEIETRIKLAMGEATALFDPATGKDLATWKAQKRKAVDQQFLQNNFPEISAQCMSETEYRVLRVKS